MKFFGAALAAVLLIATPTLAQLQVTSPADAAATGTLTTITTDTVPLTINGSQWATVQFMATSAGTASATAQTTNDGTNWLAAPFARRLSTASANPTVQAISATTLVANDVWEITIPLNTIKFRLVCGGSGTTTSVVIRAGAPFVPGNSYLTTLSDVTESGVGAGVTATVFDVSGWTTVSAWCTSPTGQVFVVRPVDDAGSIMSGDAFSFPAAAGGTASYTRSGGHASVSTTIAAGAYVAATRVVRRLSVALPAGGTVSAGHYRLDVTR